MDQQQGLDTSSNNSNDSLSQYTAELIPCQHCGEEFKNLHALREHQRVSSECCVKPYMCRLCSKSFVSRANSLRHVLHQHPEIEPAAAERMTLVNDTLLQEKLVMDSPDSRRSSPVHGKSHIGSGPPQNAHSRSSDSWVVAPPPALITGPVPPRARSGHSALVHQPQAVRPRPQQPYIITPPVPAVIKAEAQDVQEEQPLDFSMKSQNQTREHVKPRYVPQISPVILNDDNDEQPMDLTVSKRAALPAHHPSPPPAATVQRNTSRLGAILNHQSTSSTRSPPSRVQSAHPNVSRREASVVEQRLRAYPVMVPTPVFPLPPLGLDYGMPPFASQPLSFFNPVEGKFQCPYCGALFEHGLKVWRVVACCHYQPRVALSALFSITSIRSLFCHAKPKGTICLLLQLITYCLLVLHRSINTSNQLTHNTLSINEGQNGHVLYTHFVWLLPFPFFFFGTVPM